MKIPYRTRRALRRLGIALVILLMVAVVAWLCWVIWLERFVVYTRDGATLNFDLPAEYPAGQEAIPPEPGETVSIFYNEGNDAVNLSTELTQMAGYYADSDLLAQGISVVREKLKLIEPDAPVMLDVKNIKGAFYYSTDVGSSTAATVDTAQMDQLIADLSVSNHYLIARLPALRDWEYGLNHVNSGLFLPSMMGLWMDDAGCYWLDPNASGTMSYLVQIVNELKALGFDEVVLTDFRFPDSDGYVFDGDKTEALNTAATTLVSSCATDSFAVSFVDDDTGFTLPEGRTRLYLEDVSAAQVVSAASRYDLPDPEIRLVFLAGSTDTRYDAYSVLRSLENIY